MDKVFSKVPGMMDQKAFLQRCADLTCVTCVAKGKAKKDCATCGGTGVNQTFPDEAMRIFLRAELWVIEQLSGGGASDKKNPGETRWSSILQAKKGSPVSPLSLETITEFDPRECLFRNGRWEAPK